MAFLIWTSAASAAGDNVGPDQEQLSVSGRVPYLCQIGGASTTREAFDMGVLVDVSTGYLKRNMTAPDRIIDDTWCNAPSQIEIRAVELAPQNATAQLREGFAGAVHFTAAASGWSETPASFRTDGASEQSSSIQTAPQPRVTSITISLTDFRMRDGASLRPVASRSYLGAVIVTLRPTP
ncbi:hypothetical protein [Sphingobium limneticum]|uniref:Fimbrial protein n=1 Tax=Sphingobium limneticum TaxID=1007511 RepID=A0A5J5HWU1_9SPHN|nr:hypothetical protein [Sphingobium limneticum]KAA9014343.1 hypothetical protein F4U96_16960 [Sphingobium limneticum]KAA9027432.1 hypothetical protein F4U95_17085 [Sphingobium limneticum]